VEITITRLTVFGWQLETTGMNITATNQSKMKANNENSFTILPTRQNM